jgi:MFS family permease
MRLPALRNLVVAMALADVALGTVDVAVAAFARDRGQAGAAGVLLAMFALSSIAAGVLYGGRRWRWPPERRLPLLLIGGAVAAVPLALADSVLALGVLLVLAGAPSAAQFVTSSVAVDRRGGRGRACRSADRELRDVVRVPGRRRRPRAGGGVLQLERLRH